LADEYKAAATDAIKKCASLLGVGLHLYTDNGHKGSERPENGRSGSGNSNGRLSSRQFKYIMRLADEAGRSKEELDQETIQMFGSAVQFLSKADASSYIDHLLSK
jgi:hypothetical protein